ncbi:flavin monoamine oxidase family protein [Flavisphingomonas formosensis]|uniref:NAD(P)-binding protein n=1 Tax=Flavisphingomonas formosensis TaxID=861534 RepID=UPI0018E05827|nr:FAD/NAD(P)-binding protein [Sphingomonas formosensis]
MDRAITRRDFLHDSALGAAGLAALSALPTGAAASQADDYPPMRTGMRGSHPGSFENAHALRDGQSFPPPLDSGERYDLIVVGGGISGLSAAYFFRQAKPDARILILDNHDDFGGHAKRNEFHLGGRLNLLNGGTLGIDSPRPYSRVADGLIRKIGIDPDGMKSIEKEDFYGSRGMGRGLFFDRENFGTDAFVGGVGDGNWAAVLKAAPIAPAIRADIARIEDGETDYMPGLSSAEKKERLSRMSYADYLTKIAKIDPATLPFYQPRSHGWWGVGIDAVTALDCWAMKFSGFQGLKLDPGGIPRMGYTPRGYADTGGSYTLHFPDGNATIARLLVRALIPEAMPGHSAPDCVTARADYARLDRPGQQVRIRLSSVVLKARNLGDPASAKEVEITYISAGKLKTVRAGQCVLAGYNMMIPYLVPELPEPQKAALHGLVKCPLVYTSVALANWHAFDRLKVSNVWSPGCYFSSFGLNDTVDVGDYKSPRSPDEPILIRLERVPCSPGLPEYEQNKVGRMELLETPFSTFERNLRDQLGRALSGGGFDPARDIAAITVNRWPHGYAPEYNPLWEEELPPEKQPQIIARQRFGRIAIANSDSGAAAYTDSAIDQAHRAIGELLA